MRHRSFLLGIAALTSALCVSPMVASAAPGDAFGVHTVAASGDSVSGVSVSELPVIPGSHTTITTVDGKAPSGQDGDRPLFEVEQGTVEVVVESSHEGTLTVVDRRDPWNAADDTVIASKSVVAGVNRVQVPVEDGRWNIDAWVVTADDRQTAPAAVTVRKALTEPDDLKHWYNRTDDVKTVTGTTYPGAEVRILTGLQRQHTTTARADGVFGISYHESNDHAEVTIRHGNDELETYPKGGGQVPPGPDNPQLQWPIIEKKDLRGGKALLTSPNASEAVALRPVKDGGLTRLAWESHPVETAKTSTFSWAIPKLGTTAQVVIGGDHCLVPSAFDGVTPRVYSGNCFDQQAKQQWTAVQRDGGTVLQSRANRDWYLAMNEDGYLFPGTSEQAAQLAFEDEYSDSWSVEEPVTNVADRSITLSGTKIPGASVTINGAPITDDTATKGSRAVGDDSTWTTTLRNLPVGVQRTLQIEQRVGSAIVDQDERTIQLDATTLADIGHRFDTEVTRPAQVTGTAQPGATIRLLRDGAPVGTPVTAGDETTDGSFSVDVPAPNAAGTHEYAVEQLLDGIPVGQQQTVELDYGAGVTITSAA